MARIPAVVGTSPADIPISSVAQKTKPYWFASSRWNSEPKTSDALPKSPCPYGAGLPGCGLGPSTALRGMMQSKLAW